MLGGSSEKSTALEVMGSDDGERTDDEARWKFWSRSRSTSRRGSLDEEASGEEGELLMEK